jgi:hypothetical protein
VLGVTTKNWKAGELASVCFSGIVVVEANGIINSIGSEICPDIEGKAKLAAAAGQGIYCLDKAVSAGKFIRVKL